MQTERPPTPHLQPLRPVERVFNGAVGWLAGKGITPTDYVRLVVVGRKSGKAHATPVNPLDHGGRRYLVAPRGETQWVKNAKVAGRVTLQHGRTCQAYRVRLVPVAARAPLLKAYLERYVGTVQRFFTVKAGAELSAYEAVASDHPVFELSPA